MQTRQEQIWSPSQLLVLAILITPAVLAIGCGGPCVDNREGEPLTLTAVSNAATGAELESVFISNVTVNGTSISHFPGGDPVDSGGDAGADAGNGADASDPNTVYRCVLPCAITSRIGEAEFTVDADGFEPKRVTRDSDYQDEQGNGCPITRSNGKTTTVELQPSSTEM